MFIRYFMASLLAISGYASVASANSCSNVDVIGTYDESGLRESEFGINAFGTFRIAEETDESKQPMFNLSVVNCEKQVDDTGKSGITCKVTMAIVSARAGQPDADNPNCSLDLDFSEYQMKELQQGVLTGFDSSTGCFNTMLTIDKKCK